MGCSMQTLLEVFEVIAGTAGYWAFASVAIGLLAAGAVVFKHRGPDRERYEDERTRAREMSRAELEDYKRRAAIEDALRGIASTSARCTRPDFA